FQPTFWACPEHIGSRDKHCSTTCWRGRIRVDFFGLLAISNLLTAAAASLAIVGTISCLGELSSAKKRQTYSKDLIEAQSQRLRVYLYLSAAILVSGVVLIYSWLHWPDFYFRNGDNRYQDLATALLPYFGVNYSLIIFSFYVPVALILSE